MTVNFSGSDLGQQASQAARTAQALVTMKITFVDAGHRDLLGLRHGIQDQRQGRQQGRSRGHAGNHRRGGVAVCDRTRRAQGRLEKSPSDRRRRGRRPPDHGLDARANTRGARLAAPRGDRRGLGTGCQGLAADDLGSRARPLSSCCSARARMSRSPIRKTSAPGSSSSASATRTASVYSKTTKRRVLGAKCGAAIDFLYERAQALNSLPSPKPKQVEDARKNS